MRLSSSVLATAGLLNTANAALQGFNYGSTFNNNQAKQQVDFEYEFNAAKQLPGTSGWTSARLYTMIQAGTQNTPISAIQAAIDTQTSLLLGMWASAGQDAFNNELAALAAAIQQYGTAFTDLVLGISVGSEDLYRITPTGIENQSGPGAQPADLVNYISQTRNTISGTSLAGKPIGHVDTWTAYVNASNNPVIDVLDFLGVDAYPYYQTTMSNGIGSASQLFFDAYQATVNSAQGKPVWVTETGWPVTGQTLNQAEPSPDNARIYWEDVTCQLISDNVNLFYFTLQDVEYGNPVPSFGIKPGGDLMAVQPLFDLSCPASSKSSLRASSIVASRNSIRVSTSTGWSTQLKTQLSTTPPTALTTPMASLNPSGHTHLIPSSPAASFQPSSKTLASYNVASKIPEPFETPTLIVPIDKANPNKVIGNDIVAQLSPTLSTVFVYNISPRNAGKICTLVLYLPPPFQYPSLAPVQIQAPGGIGVSRLNNPIAAKADANDVGSLVPVGSISSVQLGSQYTISSSSCQAGERVAYEVDSLLGLVMNWLQLTSPPLGLFMLVK